jgi:flagellar hook-basal body complex protein FliE
MSQIDINQILTQMRVMAGGASGPIGTETQTVESESFGQLLSESLAKVSATQQEAGDLAKSFQLGDKGVELPQVMVALQEANISFHAMTQVRNKLLSAYQEIMNMPV